MAVSHPCALEVARTIYLFYASDVGGPIRIALATSFIVSAMVAVLPEAAGARVRISPDPSTP